MGEALGPGLPQAMLQGMSIWEEGMVQRILSRKSPHTQLGGETREAEGKEAAESGGILGHGVNNPCS